MGKIYPVSFTNLWYTSFPKSTTCIHVSPPRSIAVFIYPRAVPFIASEIPAVDVFRAHSIGHASRRLTNHFEVGEQ